MQNKIFQGIVFGISGLISFAFLVVLCKWCHMYHARRRRAQQNSSKDYQTYQVTQAIPGKFSDRQLYGSGQCVQPGIGGDVELARELRDGTLDFEYTLEPNVPLGKVQLSILYEIEVRKLNVLLLQAKGQSNFPFYTCNSFSQSCNIQKISYFISVIKLAIKK
jgi:hypothetical protein